MQCSPWSWLDNFMQPFSWCISLSLALDFLNKSFLPRVSSLNNYVSNAYVSTTYVLCQQIHFLMFRDKSSFECIRYLFFCNLNVYFIAGTLILDFQKYFNYYVSFFYIFSLGWTSVLYRRWGQDNRHVQWIGRFQDLLRQI